MNDGDQRLMDLYGITEEIKSVYHFGDHKYDQLKDALNYAKKVMPNADAASSTDEQ
jgi:hypothetical protein